MEEVVEDTTIVLVHAPSLGHVVVPGQGQTPDQELVPLGPDQGLALFRGPADRVPGHQGRALDLLLQKSIKTVKITIVKITLGLLLVCWQLHIKIT